MLPRLGGRHLECCFSGWEVDEKRSFFEWREKHGKPGLSNEHGYLTDISLKHWSNWPRDGAVDLPNQKARLAGGSRWFKHQWLSIDFYPYLVDPGGISQLLPHFFHMIPCDLAVFQISASRTACSFRPQLPKAWAIEAIGWKFMRHDARDGTMKMGQEWIGLGDIIDISNIMIPLLLRNDLRIRSGNKHGWGGSWVLLCTTFRKLPWNPRTSTFLFASKSILHCAPTWVPENPPKSWFNP